MSKHTSGPWTAVEYPDAHKECGYRGLRIMSPDGSQVTELLSEANARLIAAAPEMLEALNKLENQLCHGVVDNPKERANCPANWLHALVAKAEGRPNW